MMILYKVNRLSAIYVRKQFLRLIHNEIVPPLGTPTSSEAPKVLYPLTNRRLLRISGCDTPEFLQGLMTNDMRHFEEGATSMYAMFLNNKGRVLFDALIHKWKSPDSFLIECDKSIKGQLERHLKIFKLKRMVNIEDINHLYKMWVLIAPPDSVPALKLDTESSFNIYKDPRLTDLGFRVLIASFLTIQQISEVIGKDVLIPENEDGYKYLRYRLGVTEGAEDLPPAKRLPLECNCDYLHGVSFHKGCYIGQELLARVYFTGVIRKRIMPIKFADETTSHLQKDADIVAVNNPKLYCGKLVGAIFNHGIGVLKTKEALQARNLMVRDCCGEVVHPSWWPIEAPKDTTKTRNPIETLKNMEEQKPKEESVPVIYEFKCSSCNVKEKAHYKGTSPPFSRNVVLKYPSYVMKDPFSPPGKGEILVLGADCAVCDKTVCINKECSLFYFKTYCIGCAFDSIDMFPVEIKSKLAQGKNK